MAETIKIGGELESMATGKIVAAASAIKDKTRNKTQETINGDVEQAFSEQSEQFQRLSEETAESVSSAENAARQSKQYLADLKEAITDLPDGQAVSAQVAINQVDIAGLKSDIVVDLSTRYNTSYANLSAALTVLNSDTATDVTGIKKGGVSIKFINSTSGKYEQWNLKSSSWSAITSAWALDVDDSNIPVDKIEVEGTQSEEQAIIYETDGGVQVGKIDASGADFANLKRGGQQVARMSDLPTVPTLDTSIGSNPSDSHTPSSKAVKDYVDNNIPEVPEYPIETETTQSEAEEVIFGNDAGTQQYVKVSSEGVRAVAYKDMQGHNVIPVKDTTIGETPSQTNVPTSSAVAEYVEAHGGGDYPIETETIQSEDEDCIILADNNKEEIQKIKVETLQNDNSGDFIIASDNYDGANGGIFLKVNSGGVFAKRLFNLDGTPFSSDLLNGKKWAVFGDSFTEGYNIGAVIEEGKYAGKNASYPWIIGNRTGIEVLKFFANGRTLAFPATPGTFTNSITNPTQPYYYQNIPVDVDYITFYIGINDSHHAGGGGGDGEDPTGYIPLGDITDNATSSYYGAWNVVLAWLLENRPFAHIGIIVSNGCDSIAYREAQIAIAKKYGIPYIDLNGDERTPAMIRALNNDIPNGVKNIRLLTQSLNYPTNTHPNAAAYKFESTFIESFLRSI